MSCRIGVVFVCCCCFWRWWCDINYVDVEYLDIDCPDFPWLPVSIGSTLVVAPLVFVACVIGYVVRKRRRLPENVTNVNYRYCVTWLLLLSVTSSLSQPMLANSFTIGCNGLSAEKTMSHNI